MEKLDLENEKISRLIKKFAIPCVISMVVATLFNLSLGAKDNEKANKSVGNGLIFLLFISIILTIVGLIFNNKFYYWNYSFYYRSNSFKK